MTGERGSKPGTVRRYEVDLTTRETFTVIVEAASANEARRLARDPNYRWIDNWANGDRTISGIKSVRPA